MKIKSCFVAIAAFLCLHAAPAVADGCDVSTILGPTSYIESGAGTAPFPAEHMAVINCEDAAQGVAETVCERWCFSLGPLCSVGSVDYSFASECAIQPNMTMYYTSTLVHAHAKASINTFCSCKGPLSGY
jgi:hypothetical protein